jgi:hypothetical protein
VRPRLPLALVGLIVTILASRQNSGLAEQQHARSDARVIFVGDTEDLLATWP